MHLDLSEAWKIAVEVHGNQRDNAGEPYLLHVARVVMSVQTDLELTVAILHDCLEDADTVSQLAIRKRIYGFYGTIVGDAVCALTRGSAEPYANYIRRVSTNDLAVRVKFADIADNRRLVRLRKLPRAEADRLFDKYEQAWHLLESLTWEHGCATPAESPSPQTPETA